MRVNVAGAATRVILGMAFVLGVSVQAIAQRVAFDRAYRGLFGAVPANTKELFTVAGTLGEAYDDNVMADVLRSPSLQGIQDSGFYTSMQADANYNRQGRRFQVGASASTAWRYYGERKEFRSISHSAGAGVALELGPRANLFVNQGVAYSPSYLYALFPSLDPVRPGDGVAPAPDYAVDESQSYLYYTVTSLNYSVGPRQSVSVSGEFSYTDFVKETAFQRDMSSHGVRGQFSRSLSRRTAFRVGYRYRNGDFGYGGAGKSTEHGVDIGMDYTPALSATRRALVSFTLGSSVGDIPESPGSLVAWQDVRLLGDISLGYQFGRTWQAKGAYRRGLDYVAQFRQPVFTNGFSALLQGLVSRRVDVEASAGYSSGRSALTLSALTYDTYTGNLRFRCSLTQRWAAFAEYLYYYYDYRGNTQLPLGVPPGTERNGVRVGLMLWVPLLRR